MLQMYSSRGFMNIDPNTPEETKDILIRMEMVRQIAAKGHKARQESGVSLRQPLASLIIKGNHEKEYNRVKRELGYD